MCSLQKDPYRVSLPHSWKWRATSTFQAQRVNKTLYQWVFLHLRNDRSCQRNKELNEAAKIRDDSCATIYIQMLHQLERSS